jgi:hypothetical protein
VFTARYALSPYIKQIRFVFKGLMLIILKTILNTCTRDCIEYVGEINCFLSVVEVSLGCKKEFLLSSSISSQKQIRPPK